MSTSSPDPEVQVAHRKRTPLPKCQLFAVLCVQLTESITTTVLGPFLPQLVKGLSVTGGDEKKAGYYVGLLQSLFFATKAVFALPWGRLSDRIGRKPVLLVGLLGVSIAMICFGLSKRFWGLMISQSAHGAFNGSIVASLTIMTEISDPSNLAQIFAFLPLAWAGGSTIGPLIGGMLADPTESLGLGSAFFRTYPYFLPCITTASISILATILAFLLLKETLSSDPMRTRNTRSALSSSANTSSAIEGSDTTLRRPSAAVVAHPTVRLDPDPSDSVTIVEAQPTPPPIRSLLVRRVLVPVLNYAFLAFVDQCFINLLPLMYSTSISQGGLGFSSVTIGGIMGVWGAFSAVTQVFVFPKIMRSVGARRLYTVCFSSYLVCIGMFPLESLLAKRAGRVDEIVWVFLVIQLIFYIVAFMCYGSIFIYISEGAPTQAALGATNGLASTAASILRALAASTASSLFAESQERDLLGGTLVYWVLWTIVGMGVYASLHLPKRLLAEEPKEISLGEKIKTSGGKVKLARVFRVTL